jgi:hypothetical protein
MRIIRQVAGVGAEPAKVWWALTVPDVAAEVCDVPIRVRCIVPPAHRRAADALSRKVPNRAGGRASRRR